VFFNFGIEAKSKPHPISKPSLKPTLKLTYENLPIINKTKHPSKGMKKMQDGRTRILANEKSLKESGPLG